MPELPEVETIVRGLQKKIIGRKIKDVWTDAPKIIKKPKDLKRFRQEIRSKKIERIWRRGKNILFNLSDNKILLVHQKLTGHLLYGRWQKAEGAWRPVQKGPLEDPMNRFLHLIFFFDNEMMLALSDLRKFAKVELWDREEFNQSEELKSLGPEPLGKDFTFKKFKECLSRRKGAIKQVLMDQKTIAGIGNIYSDEILWEAKLHPLKDTAKLSEAELKEIYQAIKKILKRAIELKGDSMSDYRLATGEKGGYQNVQKAYRQAGKACQRKDGEIIKRIKIGGRSAHFCPKCQVL